MNIGYQYFISFWWLAILGLLLPLIIHLWNRKEGKRIQVGSIQWLELAEETKVSSLRFSELWRFLLRLLIIALFLFLLLRPFYFDQTKQPSQKWLLIEPNLLENSKLDALLDSFEQSGYILKTLDYQLQDVQDHTPLAEADSSSNYWSILQQIEQEEYCPDTISVLAEALQNRLSGPKPSLPFAVDWIEVPGKEKDYFIANVWPNGEELVVLFGQSDEQGSIFEQKQIQPQNSKSYHFPPYPEFILSQNQADQNWLIETATQTLVSKAIQKQVYIHSDKGFDDDRHFLEAGLKAVTQFTQTNLTIFSEDDTARNYDWVFWLSYSDPDLRLLSRTEHLAIFKPDFPLSERFFIEQEGKHLIVKRIALEEIEALPHELLALLFVEDKERMDLRDKRTLTAEQYQPNFVETQKAQIQKEHRKSLHLWIAIILLLLFLTERLLSNRHG
jgi:hypothetical protein